MTSVGYSSSQVASSLTRDGIARVDLAPWVSDLASTDAVGSALRPLVVVVRVERGGAGRFRLRASLRFADDRAAGRAPGLDQFAVTMQWEGQFGWSV
jgi:hypothetical protein